VIKYADYIIDLGPEGGAAGGRIVAEGTPEEVAKVAESHTGAVLRRILTPPIKGEKIPTPALPSQRAEGTSRAPL